MYHACLSFVSFEKNNEMIRTALLLLFTLVVIPVFTYYFDDPLQPEIQSVLTGLFYIAGAIAVYCFVVGELTKNYSQVDKLWSISPLIYAWYIAHSVGYTERSVLMAVVVSLWGARLTYNFARRGGYSWKFWTGEEDYRWPVLREMAPLNRPWVFSLFNLLFISGYQNALILLFTLPALYAVQTNTPLNWLDYTAAFFVLFFVVIEFIADQQQYDFQTEKHRRIKAGIPLEGKYEKGFVAEGLWSVVRHPNYMAEQSVWISFYFFSVAASGNWLNWSVSGALLLVILFKGSSDFSENISAGKYPDYKEYQQKVPRFIPFTK